MALYGGFAGYETLREQRNWLVNETVLTGDTDSDGDGDVSNVVKAVDINEGTIDGFVIERNGGNGANIYCSNAGVTIEHNRIMRGYYGVKFYSYSQGSVCYNEIRDNGEYAVYYHNSDAVLLANNWIHHNNGHAVWIADTPWGPLLRNNTIVDNGEYGVYGYWADVNNCIMWGNADGSLSGLQYPNYSCIEGGWTGGEGNISSAPCFVADANDPNNYHLAPDSPCIDTGDPDYTAGPNETDIDGEDRIIDGNDDETARLDMGADEYYWSPADFDFDGFVNFVDYAIFAAAWQCSQGEPNYNGLCNLADDNNAIDYNDLRVFCEDWLWYAPWRVEVPGCRAAGMGLGESMMAESMGEQPESKAYEAELDEADIEELVEWLEEVWEENEELQKTVPEEEWEEFIEAVKSELE